VSAVDDSIAVLLDIVALARRERIVLTAGSVAYFTFISLVPLLLLLVAAVSLFGADVLVRRVVNRAARTLTPESADLLQEIVLGAASDEGATVVGAVVLFWGALLTFRALDTTFTGIYDTRGERSLLGTAVDVVLVFTVIVLAAVAMVAVGVVLSTLVRTRLWSTVEPLVLFAVLAVVFFPLYYVLPDVGIGIGEAAPGTVFAAAAWTVLQALFGYYAAISVTIQLYGTASAILLILVWLYVGGFVLLVGAALNAVLAGRVDPDAKWVPIDRF
jgi:membrane protein